ncbi:MAG: hypothetical protein H7062_03725, partial [Candidatus Saccharimonas sp.]|nr:hypothetical protein [Planctomycetaceae bacterium]
MDNSDGLREALTRGLADGGNLREELQALGECVLTSYYDAGVLIAALEKFVERPVPGGDEDPAFRELTRLFQSVLETDAFLQLTRRGIPLLLEAYDARLGHAEEREGDLLFALQMFARYGVEEGLDRVVAGAFNPALSDGYLWPAIFEQFKEEDPILSKLIRRLSKPLPGGFARVAFLDWTNRLVRKGTILKHPFNSPGGTELLQTWLASSDEDDFSFAHSATAAIPFVVEPARTQLLVLAMDHPDINVQMEAAWASARLGNDAGRKILARQCLDHNYSMAARAYLEELGLRDAIPKEADEPGFRAKARMCEWLSLPKEFGHPPDDIELFDARELHWTPTRDWRPVWLFKFRYAAEESDESLDVEEADAADDETGIGMVGSIIHSLADETNDRMSPLDIYALHCCWELKAKHDSRAPKVRSIEAGR